MMDKKKLAEAVRDTAGYLRIEAAATLGNSSGTGGAKIAAKARLETADAFQYLAEQIEKLED